LLLLLSAVTAAAVVGALAWLDAREGEPYRGYPDSERVVIIAPGSGSGSIGRTLVAAGVVRDSRLFRSAVWRSGSGRRLQAGEYRFTRPMTVREVIDKLARGDVVLWPITFPEGLSIDAMAATFKQAGVGSARTFLDAARSAELVHDLDPAATDLEGYLFPDTYALPRGATAARLTALMVARFRAALTADLQDRAQRLGLSVRQAVTLASLIEKETARADERPLISAVYHNRLRAGMLLQCDPTVIYALERVGRYTGNVTRADLAFDSPYNTYLHRGLPPGPIAAPGLAALEAAVQPAPVNYLYFVSRNDGSHVFASTLREHNAHVRRHQVQYFRERRIRERAARR
jgi:UPF0755 protein